MRASVCAAVTCSPRPICRMWTSPRLAGPRCHSCVRAFVSLEQQASMQACTRSLPRCPTRLGRGRSGDESTGIPTGEHRQRRWPGEHPGVPVPPATAQTRELTVLSCNHFVPHSDEELKKQAAEVSRCAKVKVTIDSLGGLQLSGQAPAITSWHYRAGSGPQQR